MYSIRTVYRRRHRRLIRERNSLVPTSAESHELPWACGLRTTRINAVWCTRSFKWNAKDSLSNSIVSCRCASTDRYYYRRHASRYTHTHTRDYCDLQDEIIVIEHLPGRRVHLQDFFWTDAEDAPPWVDLNQGLTFYETKTIHHTVTLYTPVKDTDNHDDHPLEYDPKCTTCIEPTPRLDDSEDHNIAVIIEEDPGPRYWLLTVLRSGEAIPPKVELKLARLYRTAFSRQQQRHLGLLQTDPQSQRLAGERALVRSKPEISTSQEVSVNSESSAIALPAQVNLKSQASTLVNYNKSVYVDDTFHSKNLNIMEKETLLSNKNVMYATKSTDDSENSTENLNQQNMQDDASFNLTSMAHKAQVPSENQPIPEKQISNVIESEGTEMHSELRLMDTSAVETVHVRMQNTSVTDGGATRLIYSVHLGGKPVPAETAARDMALLSPQEVALELGAPVLIQSEPYLKESQPLALSRKRDAWLLVGAAGAGFILLAFILAGLIFTAKRKRAHSAVAAPLNRSILKKKQDYASAGPDNVAFSTSQREIKTENTSQTQASRNISRTPDSPETPDRLEVGIHEVSNGNDREHKKTAGIPNPWEHSSKKARMIHERMSRTNAVNTPRTSDSTDVIVDHLETFDSLDTNYTKQREKAEDEDDGDDDEEEATASPHSYLSMPSCKEFPSMKGVEPLSRVLEPVIVKHLDVDSPELVRGASKSNEIGDKFFARTSSATKDPGVVGPLVWNLRRQALSTEGNDTSGTDDLTYIASSIGPVRRARKRLHELLEDSFSLFGSRDPKSDLQSCVTRPTSATGAPDVLTIFSETRGRSAYISPVSSPTTEMKSRARPSLPQRHAEQSVGENEHSVPARSRSSWGSRPLSAGPFHRPNLPDVDTNRILVEYQLPSEDPAVPLIASIKKELEKFS